MARRKHSPSWQTVVIVLGSLTFSAFALWLTADKFNLSEVKSLVTLALGIIGREVLMPASKLWERGGHVQPE